MKIGNFMTARVVTVQPDSSVRDAAQLMLERKISGLPVVDANDHVVGIVSEHDLLRRRTNEPDPTGPTGFSL
jgi:CBS domain-containing protein